MQQHQRPRCLIHSLEEVNQIHPGRGTTLLTQLLDQLMKDAPKVIYQRLMLRCAQLSTVFDRHTMIKHYEIPLLMLYQQQLNLILLNPEKEKINKYQNYFKHTSFFDE